MTIFETPLAEVMAVLDGKPFVTGRYEIRLHQDGYTCTASRDDEHAIMLSRDATLIDATAALAAQEAGGL